MRHFSVLVTMPYHSFYRGEIFIEAEDGIDAARKLAKMEKEEIDKLANWEEADYAESEIEEIDIDYDSIVELDREDD